MPPSAFLPCCFGSSMVGISNALQLQLYDSAKFTHRFVIQNGRARVDLPDYITFKQSFSLRWGSIITIIKYLEDLCQTYSISVGFIDGLK